MPNIITKLSYTKDGNRVNVFVNNEYKLTIFKELIIDFGLRKGIELSAEKIKEIRLKDVEKIIYVKALNKLASRPHSQLEIKKYLQNKLKQLLNEVENIPNSIIKDVIERLINNNYLNDEEYAKFIIRSKIEKKSRNQIIKYLMSKGINVSEIDDKEFNNHNEDDLIKKEIEKKIRILSNKNLSPIKLKQKVIQSLIQKGFGYSQILKQIDDKLRKTT